MIWLIEIRQRNKILSWREINQDTSQEYRNQVVEELVASLPPYEIEKGKLTAHEVVWADAALCGREVNTYEIED